MSVTIMPPLLHLIGLSHVRQTSLDDLDHGETILDCDDYSVAIVF